MKKPPSGDQRGKSHIPFGTKEKAGEENDRRIGWNPLS